MQVLLAPSKTMSMAAPDWANATKPRFIDEAAVIVDAVRRTEDIERLMHVSAAIAKDVRVMYDRWNQRICPALSAYRGDAYRWFFADTLSPGDLDWAQNHIMILSGLYGGLRPLDAISAYRLEMKTQLSVGAARNLYEFWDGKVAAMIDETPDDVICVLASEEYSKVVTRQTKKRVVTPIFLDRKDGGRVGSIPIYSKMMRGVMARWIIDHRIDTSGDLTGFAMQGYHYDPARSTEDAPVFYRDTPKPIRLLA